MKIGNILISRPRDGVSPEDLKKVNEEYEKGLRAGKKLILCTLAARAGTRLLGDIVNEHENATGVTERYFEAECFYRYVKYNNLPIDSSGVIALIKYGIVQDWKRADISMVVSPFFSHGIAELNEELKPERIIFALNDPKFTTQSIYNKGFFEHHYIRENPELALGFQPSFPQQWSWLYLFGRLVPNGPFYREWEKLTRIGKIAWWGSMVNRAIWDQLQALPKEKVFIFHLKEAIENYYKYYSNFAREFGLKPVLSHKAVLALEKKSIKPWHNKEREWS
ncbi:MAG: hypothetical protein Q8P45_02415, partial [Candidatus Harrisonbacteria bacterium]|nr:hypothetical protein [Candidatus Harrisonbacteria bacterium]